MNAFIMLIGPHGIAMPKVLYFLPLWFFSSFLTPNLWGHWTDFSQTWINIYLWLYFENLVRTFPGIYHPQAWGKNAFWDQLWTLIEHISATERAINNGKETFNLQGFPYMASRFRELWSRNDWERLASVCPPRPLNFCIWCQPYRMDVI